MVFDGNHLRASEALSTNAFTTQKAGSENNSRKNNGFAMNITQEPPKLKTHCLLQHKRPGHALSESIPMIFPLQPPNPNPTRHHKWLLRFTRHHRTTPVSRPQHRSETGSVFFHVNLQF